MWVLFLANSIHNISHGPKKIQKIILGQFLMKLFPFHNWIVVLYWSLYGPVILLFSVKSFQIVLYKAIYIYIKVDLLHIKYSQGAKNDDKVSNWFCLTKNEYSFIILDISDPT